MRWFYFEFIRTENLLPLNSLRFLKTLFNFISQPAKRQAASLPGLFIPGWSHPPRLCGRTSVFTDNARPVSGSHQTRTASSSTCPRDETRVALRRQALWIRRPRGPHRGAWTPSPQELCSWAFCCPTFERRAVCLGSRMLSPRRAGVHLPACPCPLPTHVDLQFGKNPESGGPVQWRGISEIDSVSGATWRPAEGGDASHAAPGTPDTLSPGHGGGTVCTEVARPFLPPPLPLSPRSLPERGSGKPQKCNLRDAGDGAVIWHPV